MRTVVAVWAVGAVVAGCGGGGAGKTPGRTPELITVNDDGSSDRDRPHVFTRVACPR